MDVDGTTQFSDLPSCLVMDILSRLPITTLVTCRCVCKDWIRLFGEPYFIKLQLAASPMHILAQDECEKDRTICQLGQFVEDKCTQDPEERIVNLRRLKLPAPVERYGFLSSCNGLLCLVDEEYPTSVCVCNPILGEWVSISFPVRNYYCYPGIVTLVFSAKNNQYKLLRGFTSEEHEEEEFRFEIYTLGGTGQWRSIDTTLARLQRGFFTYEYGNIVLHGSVHWIDPDTLAIYCFDGDNEKFRRLLLPSPQGKCSDDQRLGVINGCLCVQLCYNKYRNSCLIDNVEIWVMKEYGVEKSWIKILTFHLSIDDGIFAALKLLSLNEDEISVFDYSGWFLTYNLKTTRLRRRCKRNTDVRLHYKAAYKPSFISLQEVAKGEEVMLYQNHGSNPIRIEGGS